MTSETRLTDAEIAELLEIYATRKKLCSALRELQERRKAERKEWQLVPLNKGAFLPSGLVDSEADADSRMTRWPNTYRKQYRIAAGPWVDAESEKENADDRP